MTSAITKCPSCGVAASGSFCRACGAATGASACPACGAESLPGSVYCGKCGRALGSSAPPRRRAALLAVAGLVVVVGAVGLARARGTPVPATPAGAVAPNGAAATGVPDISRMTPAERFDRLYRRVMQAARTGDTMSASLAPMAIAAYEMLDPDSLDADTRYHAALIKLHLGDAAGAAALGDSILTRDSTHLLGYVARGMAFRWARDTVRLRPVYAAFRRHVAAELGRGRPEYEEHGMIIGEFRQAAEGKSPPSRPPV